MIPVYSTYLAKEKHKEVNEIFVMFRQEIFSNLKVHKQSKHENIFLDIGSKALRGEV